MLVAAPKPEDAPRTRAQPLSEIGCDSVGMPCISLAARVPVPRAARAFYHCAAACYHEAPMGRTAGIILIGNELLSGKVVDANAAYLCRELRALGVDVRRIVVIPDEVNQIAAEVAQFSGRFDVVFTSGGVGPTHDDVTIEGVARAFGVPVVRDARMVEVIQRFSGGNLNAARLRMAEIPEGALPMMGDGLVFPAVVMKNVYVLPGVPELFRQKIQEGRLSRPQMQGFAKQFFLQVLEFPRAVSALHSRCPDLGERVKLAESVYEEETGRLSGSKAHPELFLDFATGLGLRRDEVLSAPALPSTAALIHWFEYSTKILSFLEGVDPISLAAVWQVVGAFDPIARGLQKSYVVYEGQAAFV